MLAKMKISEHSVQGISNFRHRLHADKVSNKVSDKERKITGTLPSLARAQAGCARGLTHSAKHVRGTLSSADRKSSIRIGLER